MLTKPQIESIPMKYLKVYLHLTKGILLYTASTMEEQRAIAEYINHIDGEDYEIWDFSQKEQHPMHHPLRTENSKLIISNMQEIGVAPYCKPDDKATVNLQDKVEWFNRGIPDESERHEGKALLSINMARDRFFLGKKVICGMHPNFLEKMEHMPYNHYIDDWLDYVTGKVKFNENPEFTQSLPISSFQGDNQLQIHDMVFVFQNRVVRWPKFNVYSQLTEKEFQEKLQELPEIYFPKIEEKGKERE